MKNIYMLKVQLIFGPYEFMSLALTLSNKTNLARSGHVYMSALWKDPASQCKYSMLEFTDTLEEEDPAKLFEKHQRYRLLIINKLFLLLSLYQFAQTVEQLNVSFNWFLFSICFSKFLFYLAHLSLSPKTTTFMDLHDLKPLAY